MKLSKASVLFHKCNLPEHFCTVKHKPRTFIESWDLTCCTSMTLPVINRPSVWFHKHRMMLTHLKSTEANVDERQRKVRSGTRVNQKTQAAEALTHELIEGSPLT